MIPSTTTSKGAKRLMGKGWPELVSLLNYLLSYTSLLYPSFTPYMLCLATNTTVDDMLSSNHRQPHASVDTLIPSAARALW